MTDPASKLSWDDLRVIRAIGNTGALAAGAGLLGINTSTIARRLSKVEEVFGATLFDRRRAGYIATVKGQELIALAERVELDVVGVARRVAGQWQGHAGDLRKTTSDSILLYFLAPVIASFMAQNPAKTRPTSHAFRSRSKYWQTAPIRIRFCKNAGSAGSHDLR